jgi:hypothetical protein
VLCEQGTEFAALAGRGKGEPVLLITGWTIPSAVLTQSLTMTCRTFA